MTGAQLRRIPFQTPEERAAHAAGLAGHLHAGGLLAYPTETVYGFGCTLRADALAALVELKAREPHKPFLVLVASAAELRGIRWTPAARALAAAFWPGALTLALAAEPGTFPGAVLAPAGTVAVRVSPHPAVRVLLAAVGEPITSTSANLPGRPPALSGDEAAAVVGALRPPRAFWLADGGVLPASAPSTLVDCSGDLPRVVRGGAVPMTALRSVVPEIA